VVDLFFVFPNQRKARTVWVKAEVVQNQKVLARFDKQFTSLFE
jgi:hypothetical protein